MSDEDNSIEFKEFRFELATLIVEALVLDEVTPEEIDPDEPLFGDGLSLDSIDALEIAFAVQKKYGVKLSSEDERNKEIFASLNALSKHISEARKP